MPLVKLIGLTLFVTAVFLLLVAGITKTTHLEFQVGGMGTQQGRVPPSSEVSLPVGVPESVEGPESNRASQVHAVPILWPLTIAAGAGLLVWFAVPDNSGARSKRGSAMRKRRKR